MTGIGWYVKEKRIKKGISARELSRRSGISQPYLSQLENGKNKNPSVDVLNKLAKGLGITNSTLMMIAGYIDDGDMKTLDDAEEILKSMKNFSPSTPEEIQESMQQQQKELTRDLDEILTDSYFVKFKGKLLDQKDKQKILTLIETILD